MTAGPLKVQDLVAILPMLDTTGVLACSGRELVAALENGVSQYPKLEGRFPQVGACLERLCGRVAGWFGGWVAGEDVVAQSCRHSSGWWRFGMGEMA
jgi:hypothetical protein